ARSACQTSCCGNVPTPSSTSPTCSGPISAPRTWPPPSPPSTAASAASAASAPRSARRDGVRHTPRAHGCGLAVAGREGTNDLVHAGLKFRDGERLFENSSRPWIPAHTLVVLGAAPLRIHRHLGAIETAMQGRAKEAGCPADKFIGHTRKQ